MINKNECVGKWCYLLRWRVQFMTHTNTQRQRENQTSAHFLMNLSQVMIAPYSLVLDNKSQTKQNEIHAKNKATTEKTNQFNSIQ